MHLPRPRNGLPRAAGLTLVSIAAGATLAGPSVPTSLATDRVVARAEALPSLGVSDGKRYARRTVRRRFDFFHYSSAKGIDCGTRLSLTERRCEVRWHFGDVGYRAGVTVRVVPAATQSVG